MNRYSSGTQHIGHGISQAPKQLLKHCAQKHVTNVRRTTLMILTHINNLVSTGIGQLYNTYIYCMRLVLILLLSFQQVTVKM